MKYRIFILYLVVSCGFVFAANKPNIHQVLHEEYEKGIITKSQELYYRLASIYDQNKVPENYRDAIPAFTRQTTQLKMQVLKAFPDLNANGPYNFEQFFSRPAKSMLNLSLVSNSGLFKIHYTDAGTDSASLEFIQQVAEAFDKAYDYEVNELGYLAPPIDDPADPEYDVYIHSIPDYGATTPENPVSNTSRDDYTSWVEMDNDFMHTATKGVDAVNITAAHEFFHMIQLGYRSFMHTRINSIFLFEMSASWMEDVMYDDVNDYLNYLGYLFTSLDQPFHSMDGGREYGNAIFFHMLQKKYGIDLIRNIWEQFITLEPYPAFDEALLQVGSNLKNELAQYAVWNYFTGSRNNSDLYYPEGSTYPEIEYKSQVSLDDTLTIADNVRQQSFNYYKLTAFNTTNYEFTPMFEGPENWMSVVITDHPDCTGEETVNITSGNSQIQIDNVTMLSDFLVCPVYVAFPEVNSLYSSESFKFRIKSYDTPTGPDVNNSDAIKLVKPNPFMPAGHGNVKILYNLQNADDAHFIIFNENGQQIIRKSLGQCQKGLNYFKWDGTNESGEGVVSGIYLIFIETDKLVGPAKIALIR